MNAYERFLNYARIYTQSDPESETHPSSPNQFDLARILEKELKELGAGSVILDEHCLVYAFFEATKGCENKPKIGFLAHMDTAPDFSGKDVKPQKHERYDGGVLLLGDSGRTLDPAVFPHLPSLAGRTLITSDGTTLLGADDKAGIAEIMTMLERLKTEKIPHGRIAVCFTPDEEVGMGVDCIDLKLFDCDFAYTVDGGEEGEVVYENFNAATAVVSITGVNVHPGSAFGVMVNASEAAARYISLLPAGEKPCNTSGYEGFFHLTDMEGSVESAKLTILVRDHDFEKFENRKALLGELCDTLNRELGGEYVRVEIKDSYFNMANKIKPAFFVVERALRATREAGLEPVVTPIRGGTDGARLSFMGLPTPNLGTGGYAYHGPYEHVTVEGMDKAVEILVNIAADKE